MQQLHVVVAFSVFALRTNYSQSYKGNRNGIFAKQINGKQKKTNTITASNEPSEER